MEVDLVAAIRELDEHPDTVFTVLTGEGRFFCAGADVRANKSASTGPPKKNANSAAVKKLEYLNGFNRPMEILRSIIDHKKVFVVAMNGPGVGGGAVWFQGVADILLAAQGAYLMVPFSSLGLVPENGSSTIFAQHMGVHRANEFLMFGRRVSVEEFEKWGFVNRVLPAANFQEHVLKYLNEQLEVNDGKSMMEAKRLQNAPLRASRILAVYDSVDALAERFVEGAPTKRFEQKKRELEGAYQYLCDMADTETSSQQSQKWHQSYERSSRRLSSQVLLRARHSRWACFHRYQTRFLRYVGK